MEFYVSEWLNLILRFLHLVTGIAWIGASFYFIWLDNHLEQPPQWKLDKGIKGDLWAVHGGGFYEVAKYQLAPPTMPQTLHWFKWEAYSTWITGFLLLSLMYYAGANTYLIDKQVADLSQWQAIGIGLGAIVGGWLVYDTLCNTRLADNGTLLGAILVLLATVLAWGLTQVFSARGAFIHMGAVIGTIMAGNVFRVIIPSQKALVEAVSQGGTPDPKWGTTAKLRSTHNTYATLPVIYIMISNHYPMTYNHSYNWLILIAIIIITATARQYFVLRHKGKQQPWLLAGAGLATIALAIAIAPPSIFSSNPPAVPKPENAAADAGNSMLVDSGQVEQILRSRCATCHSSQPSDDVFKVAPAGVILDDLEAMRRWAPRIQARTIDAKDMPFLNKTKMTDGERDYIARWLAQGAPTE